MKSRKRNFTKQEFKYEKHKIKDQKVIITKNN